MDSTVGGEDREVLRRFLPVGWQEEARRSGTSRRTRGVDGAESLLRVLLMHLAAGCPLAKTAARARTAGLAQFSAVALFKRRQASEEWLRWLAAEHRKLPAAPFRNRYAVSALSMHRHSPSPAARGRIGAFTTRLTE